MGFKAYIERMLVGLELRLGLLQPEVVVFLVIKGYVALPAKLEGFSHFCGLASCPTLVDKGWGLGEG